MLHGERGGEKSSRGARSDCIKEHEFACIRNKLDGKAMTTSSSKSHQRTGEQAWAKIGKVVRDDVLYFTTFSLILLYTDYLIPIFILTISSILDYCRPPLAQAC